MGSSRKGFIQSLTVEDALEQLDANAQQAGFEAARYVAECLVSNLLSCSRLELHLRLHECLNPDQERLYRDYRQRVRLAEPVAYILGKTDFLDLSIACDSRALIPRPETEQWLADVLAMEPVPSAVVDVGTGTGCIALAVAMRWPSARVIGIDYDSQALSLAHENARAIGNAANRIEWREGDLLDELPNESADLILANLPYIDSGDWATLPPHVKTHEPKRALDGGPEGTVLIKRLVYQARNVLTPTGSLYLEIGASQGAAVKEMLLESGFVEVRIHQDWSRRDRVVSGMKPSAC